MPECCMDQGALFEFHCARDNDNKVYFKLNLNVD